MKGELGICSCLGGDCELFLADRASEILRKSTNDVLPQFLAPTTRILPLISPSVDSYDSKHSYTYLNGVGSFLLRIRRGLLMVLMALLA